MWSDGSGSRSLPFDLCAFRKVLSVFSTCFGLIVISCSRFCSFISSLFFITSHPQSCCFSILHALSCFVSEAGSHDSFPNSHSGHRLCRLTAALRTKNIRRSTTRETREYNWSLQILSIKWPSPDEEKLEFPSDIAHPHPHYFLSLSHWP
ncbi:hypothetical protein DL98DRAFT_203370 [Cadophora sp. DSE1049]|nr:hypothetical protein DL98DRAFT_203370 [Cadophora sp. DSE1049]